MAIAILEVPTFDSIPGFVPSGVLYFTEDTNDLYIGTGSSIGPAVTLVSGGGGGSTNFSDNEIPSGVTGGATVLTVAQLPITGSMKVFLNGIKLLASAYSVAGSTITLVSALNNTDTVDVCYRY